jgi:SAM-dependent methyltransferase
MCYKNHMEFGEFPITPRRRYLYQASVEMAENPTAPGNDPIYAKMSEAAAEEILNGDLGDVLETNLELRESKTGKVIEAHHAMQLTRRSLQDLFLKMFPREYPQAADSVSWVRGAINVMLSDPSMAMDFDAHMIQEDVRSNVDKRYAAFLLIARMYQERLGEDISILDVGCSVNNGLKVMASNQIYRLDEIEVVDSTRDRDESLTSAANAILASRLAIGASMGVDMFGLEFDNRSWVRSCSFYPTELMNPAMVMRFDDLMNMNLREIGFYQGNFANDDEMEGLPGAFARIKWESERPRGDHTSESLFEMAKFIGEQRHDSELFDMVTFCTSMYLMSQADRLKAIERAKRLVKKTGLIVIQDFAEAYQRSSTGLRFHNNFQYAPYPYRTYVIPGGAEKQTPRHIFSWENGRAGRLMLGAGTVSVNGAMRSPSQLLRAAGAL